MANSIFTDENKEAPIDDQSSTDSTQNAQKIPDVKMFFPTHLVPSQQIDVDSTGDPYLVFAESQFQFSIYFFL